MVGTVINPTIVKSMNELTEYDIGSFFLLT